MMNGYAMSGWGWLRSWASQAWIPGSVDKHMFE
jgi:hypothetical protein